MFFRLGETAIPIFASKDLGEEGHDDGSALSRSSDRGSVSEHLALGGPTLMSSVAAPVQREKPSQRGKGCNFAASREGVLDCLCG